MPDPEANGLLTNDYVAPRNETEKAIEQANKTIELDSSFAEAYFNLGMTYFKTHEFAKAAPELETAVRLSGRRPVMLGMLGTIYIKLGRTDEAKKILAELESPPMNNDKLYATVSIKSYLGQSEEVWKILEQLLKERYGIMIYMKLEREFVLQNNDPRYNVFLKTMGL